MHGLRPFHIVLANAIIRPRHDPQAQQCCVLAVCHVRFQRELERSWKREGPRFEVVFGNLPRWRRS
jgi:hypothetical protein